MFIFSLLQFYSNAQDSILVDNDFVFKEGIFLSLEDLKRNNPIEPQDIVAILLDARDIESDEKRNLIIAENLAGNSKNLGQEKFAYKMGWDELQLDRPRSSIWINGAAISERNKLLEVQSNKIFAISINEKLFIKANYGMPESTGKDLRKSSQRFNRVTVQGKIFLIVMGMGRGSHDIAKLSSNGSFDPQQVKAKDWQPTSNSKGRFAPHNLIDIKNESAVFLDENSLLKIITYDSDIIDQFNNMEGARHFLPIFIRLYNEKHPFFIYN